MLYGSLARCGRPTASEPSAALKRVRFSTDDTGCVGTQSLSGAAVGSPSDAAPEVVDVVSFSVSVCMHSKVPTRCLAKPTACVYAISAAGGEYL